jgi:iron complex outermembrane receptor protein
MVLKEKMSVMAVRFALGALAAGSLIGTAAQAQQAAAPAAQQEPVKQEPAKQEAAKAAPAEVQKVYVTGSNIRRINIESASPVQIITREEMVRGGATSLTEVLKGISSNVGGIDENRTSGFTSGASGLNLRGIGSQATLVLINGRRLASYAQPEFQTTFVDLNSVPIGAVDRIEVLKDGASAIYGSEAMAGVVNIILRDNFQGLETGGSYGKSSRHDGAQSRASISFGGGSLVEDHFNAYATLDVRNRKPMLLRNRDDYIGTEDWRPWGYKDGRSIYTYPGNIYWTDKATNKFVIRPLGNACAANRLVPASDIFGAGTQGSACVFDDFQDSKYDSAPTTDRIGLTSRLTWQPNANLTVWSELMLNQNKSQLSGLPHWVAGSNGQETPALPITHPQYPKDLIDPVTGKTLAGGNGTVRVRASLTDFPGQGQDNTTNFVRYLAGVKGSVGTWDWESAFLYNSSKVDSKSTAGILDTPFVDAYKTGKFIFGGDNSALYSQILTNSASKFSSSMTQLDAKVSGELMTLPAGAVGIAAGVEMRREALETDPDPQAIAGELYHTAQSPPGFSNSRRTASMYGEATVPLFKSLEAQLAARYDHYSDYGHSFTPKVGLKWTVVPALMVRGTYAEGFRAPTLVENSTDVRHAFINGFKDPARCNDAFKDGCQWSSPYDSGANPALKPETAKSFTMGAVWEPTNWLYTSVDIWRIKRINEISTYDLDRVLADPARYANDPAIEITRDPLTATDKAAGATAGEITNIKSLLTNVSLTDIRGVDLQVKGTFNMGEWGTFVPDLNVQYTKSYLFAPSPLDSLTQYAGTRGTPKYQATLGMSWKKNAWTVSADTTYVGKMASKPDFTLPCQLEDEGYPELCNGIASFTTVDFGASYKGLFGYKNLKLSLAIQNVFDRKPPFAPYDGLGFYQPLHNAMGRYFQVSAEYRFK